MLCSCQKWANVHPRNVGVLLMDFSFQDFMFWYKRVTFFKTQDQIEYVRQLASYMDGKVNIVDALNYTKESYELTYSPSHVAVEITQRLIDAQQTSVGFQGALKEYFDPDLAIAFEMIRLNSKSTDKVNKVISLMAKEKELYRDITSTLFMPATILLMGIVALGVVSGVILPIMESRAKSTTLDSPEAQLGRIFYDIFILNGYVIVPLVLMLFIGYKSFLKNYVKAGRRKLDAIWPFKLYRQFLSLRFLTLTGLLKQSGCDDKEAYAILHSYGSKYFQVHLDHYSESYSVGESRDNYFGDGLLEPIQLIRIRRFFHGVNDKIFSAAIIDAADSSLRDITMSNRNFINKLTYFLMLTGLMFLGLGVGIVIDGTALSFD